MPRMVGKHVLMELLLAQGVECVFGNPGTSESPFMDALQDYPQIRYLLALQESVVVAMADGYARSSGKVGFANVHIAPGVGNAMSMLFDAYRGGTSLVLTAGQADTRTLHSDPHLSGDLVRMTRQYTKYSGEVLHAEQLPAMIQRAFRVAADPPKGPVFLSLPWDALDEEVEAEVQPAPTLYHRVRPDPAAVEAAGRLLAGAKNPIILVGDRVADANAAADVVRVAELTGARVYAITFSAVNYPTSHPQFLGALNVNTAATANLLRTADVVLAVGASLFPQYFYVAEPLLGPATTLIQIDSNASEIGKNYRTDVGILADPKSGLTDIARAIEALQHAADREAAASRREATKGVRARQDEQFQRELQENWDRSPIHPTRLAWELRGALPPGAILVDEAITTSGALAGAMTFDDPTAYYRIRGGAIGWGIGGALGVQAAHPERKVVAVVGDGSAMYAIQGLWTAAHEHLPVTFVICGNHAYRVLKLNLLHYLGESSRTSTFVGMDLRDPVLDFAAIANALGVHGERVDRPDDLTSVLERAIGWDGPSLVDVQLDGSYKNIF